GEKPNLANIMEQANLQLAENNKEHMFVTVFYGILDINTGEFVYVNAGHNPPLVRHKGEDEFSYIRNEKRNRVIGVSKKSKYQEQYLTLLPGDMLFIYTDGITEAMNEQRELFNENRLKSTLDRIEKNCNSNEMLSTVYKAVKQHEGNADQSDDITMLGLVYRKGEGV
ncbi:MAG: serine/threonine-protein phosphatase, partial [Candidatus Riflebacteria bacterium]|nr:serine/threonine-protein phosphatase [Candidatus Riflebacteria bacterium]